MTIANIVGGQGVPRADDPIWLYLDGWAAELGLTAPSAVARVSEPPRRARSRGPESRRPRITQCAVPVARAPTRRSDPAPVNY